MARTKKVNDGKTEMLKEAKRDVKTDITPIEETLGHYEERRKIIDRLSMVEGHVRGIKKMSDEGRPCTEVLVQLAAVRSAIDEVGRLLLENHIKLCVFEAAGETDPEEQWQEAKAGLDMFLGSRRFH
ncbi:MAG: metal-sensing transcriptional repressor [Anaerolineales bacterium]|nr:metal-sensing transcriptional repressor [Anaerolineales bacterium]